MRSDRAWRGLYALTPETGGALNWLLVGLFQWDLVAALLGGADSWLARTVYTLVGIAGLYSLTLLFRDTNKTQRDAR